jgi:hypothetical protein
MTQRRDWMKNAAAMAGMAMAGTAMALDTAIDAGADQAVTLAEGANLSGQVTGPRAPLMSIGWSKVEGPGEVVFAKPHAAATSATFSTPGNYRLMLGGFDGYVYYDFVEVTVSP